MSHHSRLISWLLLAATLAVYAVVCTLVASEPFPTPPYVWAAFDALTASLLSLVCLWSALRTDRTVWSRLAPVAAVLMATLLAAGVASDPVSSWGMFWALLPGYGLLVALLLAALWILQRTSLWQRRFGTIHQWRFSLAELLVATTAVAILLAAIRGSPFFGEDGWLTVAFIVSTVALSLACLMLWTSSVPRLLCLAGAMCIAILLGQAIGLASGLERIFTTIISADLLVQAFVLCVWLWSGAILPEAQTSTVDDPPSAVR